MKSISVLLSVFGDSPYLQDFQNSLQHQTCQDFQLIYRFDGPNRMADEILRNVDGSRKLSDNEHCGIVESYNRLIKSAPNTDFYMLADQDDVWHPDKIEKSLTAIKKAEDDYGKNKPILLHSDLRVVSSDLTTISKSFVRYQSLQPHKNELKDLMIQNNATGCTMIFNRSLRNITDIPEDAICHDWYLALIATALGRIVFIDSPLIDYRQHSCNYYGAVPRKKLIEKIFQRKKLHHKLQLTQTQAGAFLQQFAQQLSEEQIHILKTWHHNLNEPNYWKRLNSTLNAGFRKNDWLRTLGMWWAL